MKTKSSKHSHTQINLAYLGAMKTQIIKLLAAVALLFVVQASGQSQIVSPSIGQTLPHPSFTLTWTNVSALEYWITIGQSPGAAELFSGSQGTRTSLTLSYSSSAQPPPRVFVRLWSRVRSWQGSVWRWNDTWFTTQSRQNVRQEFIDALIQQYQRDHGQFKGPADGQCKRYLQLVFENTAARLGVKTSVGSTPSMPINNFGVIKAGYYWTGPTASNGLTRIAIVHPRTPQTTAVTQQNAFRQLLTQVRRGDYIQYGTAVSVNEALHTLAITADYVPGQPIHWADSNWNNDQVVNAYQARSLEQLIAMLMTTKIVNQKHYNQGATLYRIATDLRR
jgi:hypothetical protein